MAHGTACGSLIGFTHCMRGAHSSTAKSHTPGLLAQSGTQTGPTPLIWPAEINEFDTLV